MVQFIQWRSFYLVVWYKIFKIYMNLHVYVFSVNNVTIHNKCKFMYMMLINEFESAITVGLAITTAAILYLQHWRLW